MFRISPNPKQLKRLQPTATLKPIPTDWAAFMALTRIRSAGKEGAQMMAFHPYKYQELLHYLSGKYVNIDVIKSRQLGVTTCVGGLFLHKCAINPAYSGVFFMRNQVDTSNLSKRVGTMVGALKEYVLPANDNIGYLKLKNLGELHFRNSSKEGCRSLDCVSGQLYDEAAFVEQMGAIYSASSPSTALLGDNCTKFVVSTPGARSGFFFDKINTDNPSSHADIQSICDQVAEGWLTCDGQTGLYWWETTDGRTARVITHFLAHPVYGKWDRMAYLKYRQSQEPGSSWEDILREYDLKFLDSSVAVFSAQIIDSAINPEIEYESEADPKAVYYAGIDTATTGNDYVTCTILKFKNGKYSLAYLYRKRNQTSQYHQYQISQILKVFNPECVGIETTGGVGQVYLEKLSEMLPYVHFEAIKTTGDSKPMMVNYLLLALETKELELVPDEKVINELLSFRREGQKLQAAEGKHDDIVMGLCFCIMVSPFSFKEELNINFEGLSVVNENLYYGEAKSHFGIGSF